MAQTVKRLPTFRETGFDPWVGKIPWRREWQPDSVFLPGKSHGPEEPGRPQSMGSQRGNTTEPLHLSLISFKKKSVIRV